MTPFLRWKSEAFCFFYEGAGRGEACIDREKRPLLVDDGLGGRAERNVITLPSCVSSLVSGWPEGQCLHVELVMCFLLFCLFDGGRGVLAGCGGRGSIKGSLSLLGGPQRR